MTENLSKWGLLSRIDGNSSSEPYTLIKEKYDFGRSEDCDFKIENNRFLSNKHATIEVDKQNGRVWFIDSSTNGSIVNLKEKVHKTKYLLTDEDTFHLVYRVHEPEKNVAYKLELPKSPKQPAAINNQRNFEPTLLQTQMYNHDDFEDFIRKKDDEKPDPTVARTSKESDDDTIELKKKRPNEPTAAESDSGKKLKPDNEKDEKSTGPIANNDDDEITDIMTCAICNEIMHDCVCLQPCLHTYCGGCYSEWMEKSKECPVCRKDVERISKNHIVNNIIEAFLKNNPHKRRTDNDLKELDKKNVIKEDMPYPKPTKKVKKYADDYEDSDEEDDVARAKKANKAEKNEPERQEDSSNEGSIFNSDEENDNENSDSEEGSLFNSDHENDEDDDYVPPGGAAAFNNIPRFNYFLPPANLNYNYNNNVNNPYRFICRQCPQQKMLNQAMNAPDYTCTPYQNHLLCQCCLEPFPDRNLEAARDPQLPKQNCSMCLKSYCNLYWGCRKGGCQKCLTKFIDLNVDVDCLPDLIAENQFESQLFNQWLLRTNKTIHDVFNECLYKLMNGIYALDVVANDEALEKVVCRKCGIKLFQQLAYQYRAEIPEDQLDQANKKRPNCYYGKNCRTQKHNLEHAKRYNHICEQTKF